MKFILCAPHSLSIYLSQAYPSNLLVSSSLHLSGENPDEFIEMTYTGTSTSRRGYKRVGERCNHSPECQSGNCDVSMKYLSSMLVVFCSESEFTFCFLNFSGPHRTLRRTI